MDVRAILQSRGRLRFGRPVWVRPSHSLFIRQGLAKAEPIGGGQLEGDGHGCQRNLAARACHVSGTCLSRLERAPGREQSVDVDNGCGFPCFGNQYLRMVANGPVNVSACVGGVQFSNGLQVTFGVGAQSYGPSSGITLWAEQSPVLGGMLDLAFDIAGL